ncbi:MAG TPA: tyrosine-type recombinase/integrase [Metabacillus sp.]|nr:tyrosine-type recombinase/integrase [Metabacillus sp.]
MKAMFNRLDAEKLLLQGENPAKHIRKLKTDESKVKTFTDKQVRQLFSQINKESFPGFRDYCALLTMLKCGLRINEINTLETKDMVFEGV